MTKRKTKKKIRKKRRVVIKKTMRSALGLRNLLFEEIDDLRNGRISTQRVSAISRASSQIIASTKLELDFQKFFSGGHSTLKSVKKNDTLQLGH